MTKSLNKAKQTEEKSDEFPELENFVCVGYDPLQIFRKQAQSKRNQIRYFNLL